MPRKKQLPDVDVFSEVIQGLKKKYDHEVDQGEVYFIVQEDDISSFSLRGSYLKCGLQLACVCGTVRVHRLGDECTVSNIKAYVQRLEVFERSVRESLEENGYEGGFSFDVNFEE